MPRLNDLVDDFADQDVVFIAFASDGEDELREFLASSEFKYHIVAEATPIAESYFVTGAPTHVVIDRQQRISLVRHGAILGREGELHRIIRELLS
jgi:hypothetical protein